MTKQELLDSLKPVDAQSYDDSVFAKALSNVKALRNELREKFVELEKDGYSKEIRDMIVKCTINTNNPNTRHIKFDLPDGSFVDFCPRTILGRIQPTENFSFHQMAVELPIRKTTAKALFEHDDEINRYTPEEVSKYYVTLKTYEALHNAITEVLPMLYGRLSEILSPPRLSPTEQLLIKIAEERNPIPATAELAPDEEAFIEGIEFALDCGENISDLEYAEYQRLVKKRVLIEKEETDRE